MTGTMMFETEKSFEALNDMVVLLESSLYDIQVMVAQTVMALMEVMEKTTVDINAAVPMIIEGKSSMVELIELFFDEEEDIYKVAGEGGHLFLWNDLDISVQFEIVLQVHQRYVSEYQIHRTGSEEEIH